jgi:hypothetical protein
MFKKILKIKRSIAYDISYWLDQHLGGHISIGNLTIYGHNAMHWGITYWTKKYGYICFRLPFTCFGKWWPLYLYFSPNATPWAATFMIGKKHDSHDWSLAKVRRQRFGHNFSTTKNRDELYKINQVI